MAMPATVKVVVPTLVSVTIWAGLVVPRGTEAKYRLVGVSLAVEPIPARLTFCGLPAALSVTLSIAVRVLDAAGLKVTRMMQLAPAANELAHPGYCAKSAASVPVIAMPVTVKVVIPTLVRVTIWAGLVVPTSTGAKYRLVGESLAVVPTPARLTFCGLPAALSVTLSIATRVPNAVGVKVTRMLQLAYGANELTQLLCAKSATSAPVIAMPVTVKGVVPTLVSVTNWAGLVAPMPTAPKYRLVGESCAVVPTPARLTFCGLPAALSVTLSTAVRVPDAVGSKSTLMLQLDPAARELPQ